MFFNSIFISQPEVEYFSQYIYVSVLNQTIEN